MMPVLYLTANVVGVGNVPGFGTADITVVDSPVVAVVACLPVVYLPVVGVIVVYLPVVYLVFVDLVDGLNAVDFTVVSVCVVLSSVVVTAKKNIYMVNNPI